MKTLNHPEVTKNGRTWIDLGDGYYGLKVAPGSAEDTSSGKVGLKHFYPQYDPESALLEELRTNILPEFYALEKKAREEREAASARLWAAKDAQEIKDQKNGKCPKCGTWCYGDCQS